ncbi:minor capsid protein [Parageobacillus thermoglucosidasius]|uniref:minor capsid protein n=1 Tax=Parageobacillus thermoglucosidasius TaxID=1426 RepID=UPI000E169F45|nr:minor capsid protein [Parageobacillus thermoglucosidasius]MED4904123.1 minor capsid protein [Parageobacillus thermoglucosidasius]MED4915673.1 minor capsid protein [Parageobacillus thermoglucosidasius]MED4945062.1 minor capsid protein [Parageobacillus thermoglucosidasius]MED4983741.1 minor capsid protein [Parageobacillus thermoglucosidasius]RDE19320.1 minor capsid protein [Parageobacillus thermoglucosidasius]
MELLDRIIDAITANVQLNANITVGVLSKKTKSVAIRLLPNTMRNAYMDKGRTYRLSFQVLVKDKDQPEAIRVINEITEFLDSLTNDDILLSDHCYRFIACEVYTMPNFVEKTEHDEYIYTALFNAEYEMKGA